MNVDARRFQLPMIRAALCLALACACAAPPRCLAATRTTTTTYQYNADGAPTAVTTQVDAQPATTTYLTWDNFTPDSAAPTTGTVSAADGNLVGVGPRPGSAYRTQFAYDVRDRLTNCDPLDRQAASYAYDPTSLMTSSTLASGDALQFYYDRGPTPKMINTAQASTGSMASFLGPVRYLSDGGEQALLNPRKDVAGLYDASAQTLTPYAYDPYGAPNATARQPVGTSATYDLTENPFRYAGEYQDPTCNTYYLRARWYLPEHQTFLSRDVGDPLHRYSYTAGNPIGRTDPSGLKFTAGGFSHDVDRAIGKLAPGIWAYIEPVLPVWGQVMGGIEMVGLASSFWHRPTIEKASEFGFLYASVAAEALAETRTFDSFFATPRRAFGARLVNDVALGAGQTAEQSVRHGRIDVPALIQGIDTTAFGMFYGRAVAGIGYRPFNLTAGDAETHSLSQLQTSNDLLVFRARSTIFSWTDRTVGSPLLEDMRLGVYHEALIAYGRDSIIRTELTVDEDGYARIWSREVAQLPDDEQYAYVGRVANTPQNQQALRESPLGIPLQARRGSAVSIDSQGNELNRQEYTMFGRNCQMHAAGVRRLLGF